MVDDEPDVRDLCRVNLELAGHEVYEASDGNGAVSEARQHHPDLVFLDLMMPFVDGFEALRRLKEDDSTADIPVVVVTARSGDDEQVRAFSGGVVEFIAKPFHPSVLLDCVNRALEPSAPEAEAARRQLVLDRLAMVRSLRRR